MYQIDGDPKWREIMRSIADHAFEDYRDVEFSPDASTCAYYPGPDCQSGVLNASAYRSFLLTNAALDFSEEKYRKVADRNLNFVMEVPKREWLLVLFDRWGARFCGSLSHLFCLEGPRKN